MSSALIGLSNLLLDQSLCIVQLINVPWTEHGLVPTSRIRRSNLDLKVASPEADFLHSRSFRTDDGTDVFCGDWDLARRNVVAGDSKALLYHDLGCL